MADRRDAVVGQVRERFIRMLVFDLERHFVERRRVPEKIKEARAAPTRTRVRNCLGDDQIPARYRREQHDDQNRLRSEEHTSELQSLMRISYAVFGWKKKDTTTANARPNELDS